MRINKERSCMHDRVYQQNISDEGLFSFFEELITKSSQNWPLYMFPLNQYMLYYLCNLQINVLKWLQISNKRYVI